MVDRGNLVVFDKNNMYCITCSDVVLSKYNDLVNYSQTNDLLSLTSSRSSDKLYRLDMSPPTTPLGRVEGKKSFRKTKSTYSFPLTTTTPILVHHNTVTSTISEMTPIECVSYYHTMWNHCIKATMISNILHKVYPNTHRLLTVEAVKQHFPQCMACAVGSMKQRPRPRSSVPRNIEAGAEIQIDVQTWYSAGNTTSVLHSVLYYR